MLELSTTGQLTRGQLTPTRTFHTLIEHQPRLLPPDALDQVAAAILWRRYGTQIEVEAPSFRTDDQWRLTSRGWAGILPLTRQVGLLLQPKVTLHQLFGMIDLAYDLRSLHFLDGMAHVNSLPGFYTRLAGLLARRVFDRCQQGLHRAYVNEQARLSVVRGRILTAPLARHPLATTLPCAYQQLTTDVPDNQILAWTLHTVLRSGLISQPALSLVQRAYRRLVGQVTLTPVAAASCRGRAYTRLNADYRGLHALCAFLLEGSGPSHQVGEQPMIPFLVDLERLYERFVAVWLTQRLHSTHRVAAQVRTPVGANGALHFAIDLVISPFAPQAHPQRWVLDTKYKHPTGGPDPADVAQVLAYAQVQGATQAVLVYPVALLHPVDTLVNGVRLRTLAFALDDDLTRAGEALVGALLA